MNPGRRRCPPTEFSLRELPTSVPDDAPLELAEKLEDIVSEMRQRMVSDGRMVDVLREGKPLRSVDNSKDQPPEDFTKDLVIDELLDHLTHPYRTEEVETLAQDEDRWVDYSVSLENRPSIESDRLLVGAEPINERLERRTHGIGRVERWLHHEPFRADFGIATDGLNWVLLKRDPDTHAINELERIDLREICVALFEDLSTSEEPVADVLDDEDLAELEGFYRAFQFDNFTTIASSVQSVIRKKKKAVAEAFYDEYIEVVFGITDEGSAGRDTDRCLVGDGIEAPTDSEADKRVFAVQLMNRLIFVKFLEETGIVTDSLLSQVKEDYESGEHLGDFYPTFIQPLIYDVFNEPKGERRDEIQQRDEYENIPYLNGGLFRPNVEKEAEYRVVDSVLLDVVDLLEGYRFSPTGGPDELDPSVLGTVFEKTINYLAGEEGAQEGLGAYYTPDNVTGFCAEKSVNESLLENFKDVLRERWNWRRGELRRYDEVHRLLDALSPNRDVVESLLSELNDFRVVDPACGSGHFLTSVLNEIVAIRRTLYEKHEDTPAAHTLKKRTVLQNLYGVDIVGPGVEVTKLRLWLSILSELTTTDVESLEPGELALPNVAFNIREGNSLVGYTDTNRLEGNDGEDAESRQACVTARGEGSIKRLVKERQDQIDRYKQSYGKDARDIESEIERKDRRYNRRLNEKLLEDLRSAGVAFEHDQDGIAAPDLPGEALHKVSIRFDDPIGTRQKEALDEKYRDQTGMRINNGNGGYVSITLNHEYLTRTPEERLDRILADLDGNVDDLEVSRYPTLEDLEEMEYLHWPLEFYEVFDDGGFDVVIGNPPYGIRVSEAESALDEYPDENHSSMVFATRAEDLIHRDGRIAFVVPKLLTYGYRWTDARVGLLERNLEYLIDLQEAFEGVKGEQILLIHERCDDVDDDVVVGRLRDDTFVTKDHSQSLLTKGCFYMWVDEENRDLVEKLQSYESIDEAGYADATKGIDYFNEYRTHTNEGLLGIRGDDIGQFRLVGETRFEERITERSDVDPTAFEREKLVWQDILAHVKNPVPRVVLQAAVDYEGAYIADTAIYATSEEHSLEYLCGLMNSSLFSWFAHNLIHNRAIRTMHFTPIYFGRLPTPPEDDESLIEEIESLTEEIRELSPGEESALLERYEALDEAVYELYELDDDERELVNSEAPAYKKTLLDRS